MVTLRLAITDISNNNLKQLNRQLKSRRRTPHDVRNVTNHLITFK